MALLLRQISLECHPLESFGDIHHAARQLKSLRKFYRKISLLSMFSCSVMSNSFATPWTAACQPPLSMRFSRQEYWSGLPCPPSGGLPKPGIEARSLALQTDPLPSEPPEKPKNIGVGSLSLLQRIFPTQGLNPRALWILYH